MNEELKKPISTKEIEWRIQSAKNGKMIVVPYITNRTVMERFDKAFSPNGWQNKFELWRDKGVMCGIGVLCDDNTWVWKFDGADETHIEPTKGGFSDSMKRAAAQWGLARGLYDYPTVMIETTSEKYIDNWAYEMLDKLVDAFNEGKLEGRDYIVLKQKK
jgi:hypothetical protein